MPRPIKNLPTDTTKQSNYITSARYDYSPQEKRILYRVVEKAFSFRQKNAAYFKYNDGEYKVTKPVEFTMPISDFIPGRSDLSGRDYENVVDAFKSLVDKRINFRGDGEFAFGSIVNYAFQNKGEGSITFNVHQFVWQSALDFTKGFTQLDVVAAMQFKSAYTMRFYELAKCWIDKEYWKISPEEFREMFGCKDKYPKINDLKSCIISVAKKELDSKGDVSFTFEQNKQGHRITLFTFRFYRIFRCNQGEKEKLEKENPFSLISKDFKEWLENKITMKNNEIRNNIKLFNAFEKYFGIKTLYEVEETFQYLTKINKRPQDNKGLFIGNLKSKLGWKDDDKGNNVSGDDKKKIDDITMSLVNKFNNEK
jgi:Protein involved in initiation of plasmid replication